ncbi:MAG: hypothetical protein GF309_13985 [Candidatus Lokiarchaeota archaeon]|nr:hypothetical protein [Candidatus Lokiarchaeota archaeon]
MKRPTKTAVVFVSVIIAGSLLAGHMLSVDATAEFMSADTSPRNIDVGESFILSSRGGARADSNGDKIHALTKLELHFEVAGKENRRLQLNAFSGHLILNETRFAIEDGRGVVGRPTQGRFNGTTVVGFRFNVTDSEGNTGTVVFLGKVVSAARGKVLRMIGTVHVDGLAYKWRHIGRVRRA